MLRITDAVKHLIIINVLMYIGTYALLGEAPARYPESVWGWGRLSLALFFPGTEYFQPFQLVTHMFMHGNGTHLFFNMFGVYMFGSAMEAYWGKGRFLFYYFVSGFGAMLLYLLVQYLDVVYFGGGDLSSLGGTPMLGASGALFGLLAAFGMTYPNTVLQMIFPPIAMKAKYFVLIYAGIELFLGLSRFNTGIAHFAHLGGALAGVLLILYWRRTEERL